MRIKKLHIQNFKSLVDFQLEDIPQFCAFVGPNASGKSNIFEALEFLNYLPQFGPGVPDMFGGKDSLYSYNSINNRDNNSIAGQEFFIQIGKVEVRFSLTYKNNGSIGFLSSNNLFPNKETGNKFTIWQWHGNQEEKKAFIEEFKLQGHQYNNEIELFFDNFSRIFVGKPELKKINQSSNKLLIDASNTAQILGKIFQDEQKKEDFTEWLSILIPEFQSIDVIKSGIDGSFHIFVYEKSHSKPFPITLLSDGTKNILALMAAVYQSNEPQFLCIEEPENGLHPHAIETLVDFFREKCETEGHHIWLNTHSPTLIRCLEIEEVITVNKINGETKAKRFKKEEAFGMKMDEAWLTNALGGGVAWSK